MAIKLTKNEEKVQKDRLKQYQRYLPTLQLKKQQLQMVIMQTRAELEQKEAVADALLGGALDNFIGEAVACGSGIGGCGVGRCGIGG